MSDRRAQFCGLYREYRIADQRRFYEARSREYARAHNQAITVRNAFLLLAAVAGVAAQVPEVNRLALGVAATLLAGLAGAVTAYEALIGFEQLRKLYDDAALGLAEAELDWDAAELARDAGPQDLARDILRVERVFRAENGQWGQLVLKRPSEPEAPTGTPE